jgi:hypothetical protein
MFMGLVDEVVNVRACNSEEVAINTVGVGGSVVRGGSAEHLR